MSIRQDQDEEKLASYDYKALGRVLRPRLHATGQGWRAAAKTIGVTSPDLSRICSGQAVSYPKVIAVCDWLGISDRQFYCPPPSDDLFHGKSTETGSRPHATGAPVV